jgi:cellulose synthase/poly-beta-1,6-N-acetylglucosamine synthase-like glycosyltransferase
MSEQRFLVTFALFTYNQEAYVAEAVEGALSQDYSPLEIIISDDASTDRTFEIVREMVDRYRGPHEIRLLRNEVNLGIGAHVTKVANLARGELIVAAAGDDVSLPSRTSAMVALWDTHRKAPDLLCCDAQTIDLGGLPTGRRLGHAGAMLTAVSIARDGQLVHGAVATWTKRLWQRYPELPSQCPNEDVVLSLRAALAGGIVRHPRELVRYRIGAGVSHCPQPADLHRHIAHRRKWMDGLARSLRAQADDARKHGLPELAAHIEDRARCIALVRDLYVSGRLPPLGRWRHGLATESLGRIGRAVAITQLPSAYLLLRRIRSAVRQYAGALREELKWMS